MLDKTLWHVRLYQWTRIEFAHFRSAFFRPTFVNDSNTCIYLRTLLVYFPLIVLNRVALTVGPLLAIFYFPIANLGSRGLLGTGLIIVGGVAATIAAIYGLTGIFWLFKKIFSTSSGLINQALENCRDPQRVSFCGMIFKCLSDMHSKVCTRFDIETKAKTENYHD